MNPQGMEIGTWTYGDWGFFLLANAIVIAICAPKLVREVRLWMKGQRAIFRGGRGGA
jgi:hypothetical protein